MNKVNDSTILVTVNMLYYWVLLFQFIPKFNLAGSDVGLNHNYTSSFVLKTEKYGSNVFHKQEEGTFNNAPVYKGVRYTNIILNRPIKSATSGFQSIFFK